MRMREVGRRRQKSRADVELFDSADYVRLIRERTIEERTAASASP